VVAIDTMSAALGDMSDEDKAAKMNPIMRRCREIGRRAGGCCVILVHHPGKDTSRGPRGSTSIPGALDTLLRIEHDPEQPQQPRQIVVHKQRDLIIGPSMFYRLHVVELAGDLGTEVKPISSAVVKPILDPAELAALRGSTVRVRLSPQQQIVLDALREALQRRGLKPMDGKPAARVTSRSAWLEFFRARVGSTMTKATSRGALWRAQVVLQQRGLIGVQDTQVWLQEDAGKTADDDAED
jgi:hypothetical protein